MQENHSNDAMEGIESQSNQQRHPGMLLDTIFNRVFEGEMQTIKEKASCSNVTDQFSSEVPLKYRMRRIINFLEKESQDYQVLWTPEGRIGPDIIDFDKSKSVGNIHFMENPIMMMSKDLFSTAIANTCIYKGKWQFEVLLGTKGVMQIGWATINCSFSLEKGVGDTSDSYSYDGNRKRKWNLSTYKYGESWCCGDVITCTIDMDKGEIAYLRNGRSLGVAFSDIKVGPGIAYFPSVSLALDESLIVNFGATAFYHPQCGFHPMQVPPTHSLHMARATLGSLTRLVDLSLSWNEHDDLLELERKSNKKRGPLILILAQHIASTLAPLLTIPYVVEEVFLNTLSCLISVNLNKFEVPRKIRRAHALFDLLCGVLEEEELMKFLENLITSLQRCHRQVAQSLLFTNQNQSLQLLCAILSHERLRKFCLKNILFLRLRFASFVCVKCIDLVEMKKFFTEDYWCSRDGKYQRGNAQSYLYTVNRIKTAVKELEKLQMETLKLLLTSTDGGSFRDSSRSIFLSKLRSFIKDQPTGARLQVTPVVVLKLVERLFDVFRNLWSAEVGEELDEGTISPTLFYEGSLLYFDTHRLGGLHSHLKKAFAFERDLALKAARANKVIVSKEDPPTDPEGIAPILGNAPSTSGAFVGDCQSPRMEGVEGDDVQPVNVTEQKIPKDPEVENKIILKTSLLHLLDGVIVLYHIGGHKQIEKVHAQSEVVFDNVSYLEDLYGKKNKCSKGSYPLAVVAEFDHSIDVLEKKLKEYIYPQAWNAVTTLSPEFINKMQHLLRLLLGALKSSSKEGSLFAFVPDYYVEALAELCQDLRHLYATKEELDVVVEDGAYMKLYLVGGFAVSPEITEAYQNLLMGVGEFLAGHFCDARIVYADSKDSLIQALAGFVCYRPGLKALERMKKDSRLQMVRSLLQPYENRAWAQNNWVLVRFWKGVGFGFRFTKSPHLSNKLGPKPAYCETPNVMQSSAPCPSDVFLQHVAEVLESSQEISSPFLNSLLNQLNWAFSEFIGMLQEIQNASNRPERVFIDSRQLRICATCFDLALALLRVLEMIVNISPDLFLSKRRSNAQSLLSRLCQLLCQVLNRVSVNAGCFSHVVNLDIPGLEAIHYYPILTAVAGILCRLLRDDIYSLDNFTKLSATKTLLDEPSFQISSLYPLLEGRDALVPFVTPSDPVDKDSAPFPPKKLPIEGEDLKIESYFYSSQCDCKQTRFCLRRYSKDVLPFEIKKIIDVLQHLELRISNIPRVLRIEEPDTLCTICYASAPCAKFSPCNHTSCVKCITHYLMNRADCFFCKSFIREVTDTTNGHVVFKALAEEEGEDDES